MVFRGPFLIWYSLINHCRIRIIMDMWQKIGDTYLLDVITWHHYLDAPHADVVYVSPSRHVADLRLCVYNE